MKKIVVLFFFALFLLVCCSNDDDNVRPACGVLNPVQDLAWLKSEIERRNANPSEDMKYCYIVQATLNAQDVFIYEDCNPLIDKAIFILDCEGNAIDTSDSSNSFADLESRKVIWKPRDFVCDLSF